MEIAGLQLTAHRGDAKPRPTTQGLQLTAEVTWRLKGPPAKVRAVQEALLECCELIDDGLLLIRFGNAVGSFELPHLGRITVHSGKWTARHFDRMLRELTEVAAALPFAATRPSAIPFDRNLPLPQDVLYHAFVYLRHAVLEAEGDASLPTAYNLVLADPQQRLAREDRLVAPELARSVGPRALQELVSGQVCLRRAPHGCTAPLATSLRGHLPELVREHVARRFVDTAENRFAKALLGQLLWIVERMELAADQSVRPDRLRAQCRAVRRELEPVARHRFWRRIGSMVTIPAASTVLQRRRGYRELFRHFVALRLASRVPLNDHHAKHLLDARDIATLYELWCFFKVVEALSALNGPAQQAEAVTYSELDARIRHGYQVRWASGVEAAYNPRFAPNQEWRYSFSVPLRPDISIHLPRDPNAGLHLLDAKLKINNLGDLLGEDLDESADTLAERSFTRADLYKMHTYRDAIPAARSVWILYPGTDMQLFRDHGEGRVDSVFDLPPKIDGVGALPLRPEVNGTADLLALLTALQQL